MIKKYINGLNLHESEIKEGRERQYEYVNEVLNNSTFFPKTVLYEDIDKAFKEWTKNLEIVSDDGVLFPTMTLFSNQRFSEYSQSWEYVDENKNLILNFKTITRENNPKYGKIQGGLWNIPGNRFYRMKRIPVLDDNGSECFLDLKMRQPMAIDIVYKLSIFTTKYQKLNEFNLLVNDKFKARQEYIAPNGYEMPMKLENISDESSYNIDDRQFYSQTYEITLNGYVIQEEDFKSEIVPMKRSIHFSISNHKKADVEIEETEISEYDTSIKLIVKFPVNSTIAKFTIDTDLDTSNIVYDNLRGTPKIFVNNELKEAPFHFNDGDIIKIEIQKFYSDRESSIIINGTKKTLIKDENETLNLIY